MPMSMHNARTVLLNNKVYIGGGVSDNKSIIQVYTPEGDDWAQLPPCPVKQFAMAAVNDQLVLAGGSEGSEHTNMITVWACSGKWIHPYSRGVHNFVYWQRGGKVDY